MTHPPETSMPPWARGLLALGLLALGVALSWAVHGQSGSTGLGALVRQRLPELGVANPVTGVLLGFRGYDTLLEVVVLWLAWLGLRQVGPAAPHIPPANAVLRGFVRQLLPVLMLVAGYLVWVGADAPGGAFQAAAVLAAGGVLVTFSQATPFAGLSPAGERWLGTQAPLVFLAVACASLVAGQALLTYPASGAKPRMLVIELSAAVGLGWMLLVLVTGLVVGPKPAKGGRHP